MIQPITSFLSPALVVARGAARSSLPIIGCNAVVTSTQLRGHANDIFLQRACINDLNKLIHNSSTSSYYPPQLLSLIEDAAEEERGSTLSDKMYGDVTREVASFMLQYSADAAKEDRMTSEEVYNPTLLDMYDALVWGFNSPFLWRITQQDIESLYKSNISKHHCEIAVGTGLFLSEDVSSACDSIKLIDLNENSLDSCEKRIQSTYSGESGGDAEDGPSISKLVADIMVLPEEKSSLTHLQGTFKSVAANFLLHCLHGSNLHEKENAIRNCASLIDPENGVFFGSTILGKEMVRDEKNAGETAMHVLRRFNDAGVFGNLGDSMEDLEFVLKNNFDDVDLWNVGYCGVWAARNPK